MPDQFQFGSYGMPAVQDRRVNGGRTPLRADGWVSAACAGIVVGACTAYPTPQPNHGGVAQLVRAQHS